MKKKIGSLLLIILTLLTFIFAFSLEKREPSKKIEKTPPTEETIKNEEKEDYNKLINEEKSKYNNDEVVAILQIPNMLEETIVQTTNNDYYLHYDIYKNENINGASFLDYRNNIRDSKKLLIYGHSDPEGNLPFVKLAKYNNKDYLKDNKYIYLIDIEGKRKYEIFTSYIETNDFDYVNLESFNGLTYKEHLEKLHNKSFVNTNVELTEESKVLILQTCSFDERIKEKTKFQIIGAIEVNND